MEKKYSWLGEYDDDTIMNLKALCYDLNCKYSFREENGKQIFMLENLSEEQSMFLVSRIRKYGLSVKSNIPGRMLPVAIKMNLDMLLQNEEN